MSWLTRRQGESPDTLADQLADWLGIYGAHDDETCTVKRPCRCCFVWEMTDRIRESVANENAGRIPMTNPVHVKPVRSPSQVELPWE